MYCILPKRPHIQINFGKYELVFGQSSIFGSMNQYMINVFKGIWRHVYIEYTSNKNMVGDTETSMNQKMVRSITQVVKKISYNLKTYTTKHICLFA